MYLLRRLWSNCFPYHDIQLHFRVLYEGRERVMADSQIVEFTPSGRSANINPSGQTTYMTYRWVNFPFGSLLYFSQISNNQPACLFDTFSLNTFWNILLKMVYKYQKLYIKFRLQRYLESFHAYCNFWYEEK